MTTRQRHGATSWRRSARARGRRPPATTALVTLVVTALTLAGCATIPTSGPVRDGAAELEQESEIGLIPAGPTMDAPPEQIVQGFLTNAAAGPTSSESFAAAQEYLTPGAWTKWDRYARVLVLDGNPELDPPDVDDDTTDTTVTATATVVASLDENGTYTEEARPSVEKLDFSLTRQAGGEWRIDQLEDGLMLSTAFFSQAFHLTTLYFPTPDLAAWVPDVRWFPRQTWRTDATSQVLAGPPPWLGDSTSTVIPEGTTLAIDSVTVADDGTIGVSLTSTISSAPPKQRALAVAQLEATLVEGDGRNVVLSDGTTPLAVSGADEVTIDKPQTSGAALAFSDGRLHRVVGRTLEDTQQPTGLGKLDLTAIAAGPGDQPVIVRDGTDRILRVATGAKPQLLLSATDLVAPSVDRYGAVWSAQDDRLHVALAEGGSRTLDVDWLTDREILSVRVSPEGARLAVVSAGADGRSVQVAGIQRDADDVPTSLSTPVRVGAPVVQVSAAVWQEGAVLALTGREEAGTAPTVFVAGVGGQTGTGGQTRVLGGVTDPRWLTASVGSGSILVLDGDGTLFARQASSLWPVVAEDVDLVAYPG